MSDYIQENIDSKDNSRLEEFLTHYPYGVERKAFIFDLMQENKQLLEKSFAKTIKTNILKNPQTGAMIDYRIWAFSVVDMAVDKVAENGNSNPDKLFIDTLQETIAELNR